MMQLNEMKWNEIKLLLKCSASKRLLNHYYVSLSYEYEQNKTMHACEHVNEEMDIMCEEYDDDVWKIEI